MRIIYFFFISLFLIISGLTLVLIPPQFNDGMPWKYPQIWLAIVTLSAWIGAFYFPDYAVDKPEAVQRNLSVQRSIIFTSFTLTAFIIYLFL